MRAAMVMGARACRLPATGLPGTVPPLAAGTPQRQSPWSAWLFRLLASKVHLQDFSCIVKGPIALLDTGRQCTWPRHGLASCVSISRQPERQAVQESNVAQAQLAIMCLHLGTPSATSCAGKSHCTAMALPSHASSTGRPLQGAGRHCVRLTLTFTNGANLTKELLQHR